MATSTALDISRKYQRTGLVLAKGLSFDEWQETGNELSAMEGGIQWWIGDWLRYGEHEYGEKYAQAVNEEQAATWRQYVWVSNKVALSLRRDNLSWYHHKVVAALEPEAQDYWLGQAEPLTGNTQPQLSVRELSAAIRKAKLLAATPDMPSGVYRVIYADPPWKYSDELIEGYGAAEHHYTTMTTDELAAMTLPATAESAVLFMWATSPVLPDAIRLIGEWGFTYKASFVWDKVKHNYGHYNSVRHEFLLVATKGSCTPEVTQLFDSVQSIERSEKHSEKPEEFRVIIDTLYPSGSRIELFRRGEPVKGWECFGNEYDARPA